MKYQQLTEGKRYQIAALLEQGLPIKNTRLVRKKIGFSKKLRNARQGYWNVYRA
jgi:hypothetical protein